MNDTKRTPVIAVDIEIAEGDSSAGSDTLVIKTVLGNTYRVTAGELSFDILRMATMHGLKQKLVDAAAIGRDPDTGRTASPQIKIAAMEEVLNRLLAGEWNKRREGNPTGGLLLRALARLYPTRTREQLVEFLAGKSDAEKAALRRNPKVAAVIEEIRAESADDESIDSDELLAGL